MKNITDLNEIILSIKKEVPKEKQNALNIRKISFSLEEELRDWIILLKEKLYKRNYKKVINDIASSNLINKFNNFLFGYKIIILNVEAKLKIIENKIFKYKLNPKDKTKNKIQIFHCFSYANDIPCEINSLIDRIYDNNVYENKNFNDLDKRNYKIEIINDIIQCYFNYIYTMSLFHYKIGNLMESISYLSLFLNLYKEANLFIINKNSLYKIAKCFILLSKIFILNEDFENALIFLKESIKVSFKQILFQVYDIYYGVFIGGKKDLKMPNKENLHMLKDKRINKIILNMAIIYFYQGICFEILSNIKKATSFYKQSEWFAKTFLIKNNLNIYKFFYTVKKNAIEACHNIDFVKEKIQEYELKQWFKIREDYYHNLKLKSMGKENLYSMKFKGLIYKLKDLKIKEIDTVNQFDNQNKKCLSDRRRKRDDKNLFLSNLRLLEAYLRNDFKDIINDMDKINIFDLDYKTRERIQKKLNIIYFEQNQKMLRNKDKVKNSFSQSHQKNITSKNNKKYIDDENNNINNNKGTSHDYKLIGNYLDSKNSIKKKVNLNISKLKLSKSFCLNPKKEIQNYIHRNNINNKINKSNKINYSNILKLHYSSSSSSILNYSHYLNLNKNIIDVNQEKRDKKEEEIKNKNISHSKLINNLSSPKYNLINKENHQLNKFFNFKYLKKREYIKKLSDRDLLFQKLILKSKNTPKLSFQKFNKAEAQQEADNSFNKIESIVSNRLGHIDLKDILSEEEYKDYLKNKRLEKVLISSLDNKALMKYKINKIKNIKKEEHKEILTNSSKYDHKFENINVNNKNTLDDLNYKLNKIYEYEIKKKDENMKGTKTLNSQILNKFYRNKSELYFSFNKINLSKKLEGSQSISNLTKISSNKSHYL